MSNTAVLNFPTPSINVLGGEDNTIISGDVELIFPYITGMVTSGVTGFYGNVALTLPAFTIQAATGIGDVALALPITQLAITGEQGNIGSVAMALLTPVISAQLYIGSTGGVALSMPAPVIQVLGDSRADLRLLAPVMQVSGLTGILGSATLNFPRVSAVCAGQEPYTGSVGLSLRPSISASGTVGAAASVSMALRRLALAVEGYSGYVGTAALALPVMQFSTAGAELAVSSITMSLPMLVLQSNGFVQPGANFSTIVMHTESMALSTYDGYNFNSFAKFNGVYLAANGSGIFALSGASDDGAIINASARVGITDFGTSHLKRVDRMYVGYRTTGDMVLRVFTDEITPRDYLLTATGKAGMHGNHVRIGKGLAARYWQFEIQNRAGSDFEMNMIEVKPTVLRRRIGGRDA